MAETGLDKDAVLRTRGVRIQRRERQDIELVTVRRCHRLVPSRSDHPVSAHPSASAGATDTISMKVAFRQTWRPSGCPIASSAPRLPGVLQTDPPMPAAETARSAPPPP